jgi:signal transduction histidine kinase
MAICTPRQAKIHPFIRFFYALSIENRQLIINVIDNGTGIPPSAIDRISNMFYRGSEKSIGNGLGLFMVKKALGDTGRHDGN